MFSENTVSVYRLHTGLRTLSAKTYTLGLNRGFQVIKRIKHKSTTNGPALTMTYTTTPERISFVS